ncbi:MAG: OadG family protein [Tannerella sp.]|jgi:oxaloacetate decarboxylase gamma subunit|nr:OadG family protein [Tannerella sp.]
MENLGHGLLLMMVGMVTVFAVLLIVIGLGKLLINLVNKYAPEEVVKATRPAVATAVVGNSNDVSDPVVAAIVSAVSTITNGKGKVTSIKK